MVRAIFAVSLAIFWTMAYSAPELKGSPQELKGFLHPYDKIVRIIGKAEETAYSDKAIISLVITTNNKLLSQAIASNSELRSRITKSLVSSGIDGISINSSKFSSSPQYGWFGTKPSSYNVVNRMAISISDEAHLQNIAAVADQYDEAEISDTAFEHTKKDEFSQKVKARALGKILKQKEFYEKSLGVILTTIGISDSAIHQRATRGAYALEEVLVSAHRLAESPISPPSKRPAPETEPSFDEIKYEATIAVDFKIEEH